MHAPCSAQLVVVLLHGSLSAQPAMPKQKSRNMGLLLDLLLLFTLTAAIGADTAATQPVMDVLTRVLGPTSAAIFELKLDATMEQGFRLTNTASAAREAGALITVTASASPELAYGAV
jgi:hypothetical protein